MSRAAETMQWLCWNQYAGAHFSVEADQSLEELYSDFAGTCLWTGIPWHSQPCPRMMGRRWSSPQTQKEPGHMRKQENLTPGQMSPVPWFPSPAGVRASQTFRCVPIMILFQALSIQQ